KPIKKQFVQKMMFDNTKKKIVDTNSNDEVVNENKKMKPDPISKSHSTDNIQEQHNFAMLPLANTDGGETSQMSFSSLFGVADSNSRHQTSLLGFPSIHSDNPENSLASLFGNSPKKIMFQTHQNEKNLTFAHLLPTNLSNSAQKDLISEEQHNLFQSDAFPSENGFLNISLLADNSFDLMENFQENEKQ
ncbi:MAG: hypothetical protein MHPSP_003236, partial [Paramarteilia canceri]